MSKTTAQHSAEIRKALKAIGITSRQVSVRTDNYSMGSSIRITIKAAGISKDAIEKIANQHESIRYCEATQEILSGGNRFVFVDYDWDLEKQFEAEWMDAASKAFDEITANAEAGDWNIHANIDGAEGFTLSWDGMAKHLAVVNGPNGQRSRYISCAGNAARCIGMMVANNTPLQQTA